METLIARPLPKDFSTKDFGDSEFRSCETECVANNIVRIQKKVNPDRWTPFTWEEYRHYCKHQVTDEELDVLEALVYGGRPVTITSCYLQPGYLTKNDAGEYEVTDKFLAVIEKFRD